MVRGRGRLRSWIVVNWLGLRFGLLLWVIDWLGFTTLLVIILRLVVTIGNLPGLLRLGIIHWLLLVVDRVGLLGWGLVKIPLLRLVV